MTEAEYRTKKQEVLDKFHKEFAGQQYLQDPFFYKIVDALIHDIDPYAIIEALIVERQNMQKQMRDWIIHQPPAPIIIQMGYSTDKAIAEGYKWVEQHGERVYSEQGVSYTTDSVLKALRITAEYKSKVL